MEYIIKSALKADILVQQAREIFLKNLFVHHFITTEQFKYLNESNVNDNETIKFFIIIDNQEIQLSLLQYNSSALGYLFGYLYIELFIPSNKEIDVSLYSKNFLKICDPFRIQYMYVGVKELYQDPNELYK